MTMRLPSLRAHAVLLGVLAAGNALALDCGNYAFPYCRGPASQYAGGFDPKVGFGGFGGGDCKATRTPVVFVHGNTDSALGWDSPPLGKPGARTSSVYEAFRAAGYNDCELYGVTYLDEAEQKNAPGNVHRPEKYEIVRAFIDAVRAYTGQSQVDVVGHSLGVSMSLAALEYTTPQRPQAGWSGVRRFVNIAGGIRGLKACALTPLLPVAVPTCEPEQADGAEFGFFPDLGMSGPFFSGPPNRWTAPIGDRSMRLAPQRQPGVAFYTIHAGVHDQIHCSPTASPYVLLDCSTSATFAAASNVRVQADIGADPSSSSKVALPSLGPLDAMNFGDDYGGIGHFGARNAAGPILVQMLGSDCIRGACKGSYRGAFRIGRK